MDDWDADKRELVQKGPSRPGPDLDAALGVITLRALLTRVEKEAASERTRKVHAVFGFVALVVGVGAGIYAYSLEKSVWLGVFVTLLAMQVVGRGVADVVTDDKKVRRALYFAIQPAACSAAFYFSYQAWDKYWLAFLVGAFGGAALTGILAPMLFPGIHREESEDTRQRMHARTA